ncbi:uncharacterized protein PgNI_00635 [Pyricularia grisea]|uniref:Histone chaperone domain-containing protein n=1 Tax=Pyricularia grisea TaxID=148305 RepID=A0A6P8BLC3_PYRGI|nr:uncharacterized protein PgNI_00635 [Pyricularia grisea]TLD17676.1 hypothetical protein PgNI_00635 [Pyricularia grisea]
MAPSKDSVPSGNVSDNSYMSKASDPVPVVGDSQEVESSIRPGQEDSDATLERDEKDAIDTSNIIDEPRAKPGKGALAEKDYSDEELVQEGDQP